MAYHQPPCPSLNVCKKCSPWVAKRLSLLTFLPTCSGRETARHLTRDEPLFILVWMMCSVAMAVVLLLITDRRLARKSPIYNAVSISHSLVLENAQQADMVLVNISRTPGAKQTQPQPKCDADQGSPNLCHQGLWEDLRACRPCLGSEPYYTVQ